MKRFTFPLERVLMWRRIEADVRRAELAKLRQEEEVLRKQHSVLREQWQSARRFCATPPLAVGELYTLAAYDRRCQNLDAAIIRRSATLAADITAQLHSVREVERKARLLEELRVRAERMWSRERTVEEENFAAEFHLFQWTSDKSFE